MTKKTKRPQRKREDSNLESIEIVRIITNGNVYEGEWMDGQKNGKGIYTDSATKIVYKGYFEEDNFINGRVTFPNGNVYEGEWMDGKRNGKGKYMDNATKVVSEGIFDNNKFINGRVTYSNGDVYEGDWKDGERNGHGKLTLSNGKVYEGTFYQDAFVPDSNYEINIDEDLGQWFRIYLRDPSGHFIEITENQPYQFVKAKGLEYVFESASSDESSSVTSKKYVRRSEENQWKEERVDDTKKESYNHLYACV